MRDMDDFFLDDDDLAQDNQLTVIDNTRIRILDDIIDIAKKIKENINFNEETDARANIQILSRNLDWLLELTNVDINGRSDEELQEIVENVLSATTELTLENMNALLPDDEDGETVETMDDDNGIDF